MSRLSQFVQLVQTAAIIERVSRGQQPNKPSPSLLAAIAVNAAAQVEEASLPQSLTEACEKHIAHIYDGAFPKPQWLIGIL